MLLDSLENVLLPFSFLGLDGIEFLLCSAPSVLSGESFLNNLKFECVEFKKFVAIFDGGLVGGDLTLEGLLSLDESGVLVGQVSREFNPVSSLSVFSFLKDTSGFNELLSELGEELGDSGESLLVNVGRELSQGSDDGSEEGFVGTLLVKSLLDGFVLGLNLGE